MRGASSRGGSGLGSGKPGITTQIISGQSGLRHSLRGSGSGKIWKKTVLGKKFEFAGKLREKKNYIMYHSGMGHHKNVIEEFEKLPEPGPKIVEERQVIDNYGYYESKNLKKERDPRRLSITRHQRLSSPFERTVVKKYEHNTSRPKETKVYTTSSLKSSKFGGGSDDILSKYNSLTSKQKKNNTVGSKLYETYKPKTTTTSYSKTITTTTTTNRAPVRTKVNEYTSKTISRLGKPTINKSNYLSTSSTSKYLERYEPKSSYIETEPNKTYGFGDTQTKTETTQDGDYLIKITTSKKKLGGDYGSSKYTSSRTKSVPKSTESINSITKTRENPSFVYGTTESEVNLYEDKVEENAEKVNEQTVENPETFELSRSEYKTSNSSYGGPRPQPTFGTKHGYGSSRLRSGNAPRPIKGLGPKPTLGTRSGYRPQVNRPYEVISHKPSCPLFEGNLDENRNRSESQSGKSRYGNNTFSGVKREYSEVKKYTGTGRYRTGDRSFDLGHVPLNTSTKKSKTGSSSKYSYQKITTTGLRSGRNYNYYESKDIKKKKKKKPKTTFQYNRSGISNVSSLTNSISKKHQRSSSSSSSYNRTKGYKSSNLNNYASNMPRLTSGYISNAGGTQSTRKTTFKLTANKAKKNKGLSSGITSGLNTRIASGLNPDIRKIASTAEYKKYEQRGAGGLSSNYGSSSYQNDFRREEENYGGESRYQYNTEYNRGGEEYEENEENYDEYQNNEYQNNEYRNNDYQNNEYRNNEYQNNEYREYQNNEFQNNEYQNNEYRYGEDERSGGFSSQYQYMDDNEYEVVYCPVHGKQTIRRKRNYEDYY